MVEFSRILCPIDFSETSASALSYATAFARWYDAQLIVLHVETAFEKPAAPAAGGGTENCPGSYEDTIARLHTAIEQAGATSLKASVLAQEGRATELIVNCAAALKVDLLVLGTHGLGGFRRLLLGSVTEKVVRTATCPVLTVPPATPATTALAIAFKKILCPIDYSPSALKALDTALALGRQSDGRVTVLHALEDPDVEETAEGDDVDATPKPPSTRRASGSTPSWRAKRRRGARSRKWSRSTARTRKS